MKDPNTYADSAKNPPDSEFTNRDSHGGILYVREQKSVGLSVIAGRKITKQNASMVFPWTNV